MLSHGHRVKFDFSMRIFGSTLLNNNAARTTFVTAKISNGHGSVIQEGSNLPMAFFRSARTDEFAGRVSVFLEPRNIMPYKMRPC